MKCISKLVRSFRNAFGGIVYALRKEQNLRIEFFAAIFVIATMIMLPVKRWEAVVLLLVISFVLVLELLNTFLEKLVNLLKPRVHPQARVMKDLMAAAVFISSLGAAVIGIYIFWPYL
ncbi:MAG: diacylglycerol kinase family protein [Patescibacteria group bacterium]|nr:diacylglycerol kinase family protein [Patescibacteria group bacterium]